MEGQTEGRTDPISWDCSGYHRGSNKNCWVVLSSTIKKVDLRKLEVDLGK